LDEVVGACRASAISTDDWASASGKRIVPHRPLPEPFRQEQRDVCQRRRRRMSVDCGAKQQKRIGPCRLVVGAAVGSLAPQRGFDLVNPHSNGVGPAPSGPSSTYR
jgi:hypothetical protein